MGNGNNTVTEKLWPQKVNKISNMYQDMRSICTKILRKATQKVRLWVM